MSKTFHPPEQHEVASSGASSIAMAELSLREAGRQLECAGVTDPEWSRLARIVFRLAQRVAIDSGRLEPAA